MHELGKIELKLVIFARRVGTLDLTELALKACIHHFLGFLPGKRAYVPIVFVVDEFEKMREGIAVLEAHATAMTDLKCTQNLFVERLSIPVFLFRGVVGQAVGGQIRNIFLCTHDDTPQSSRPEWPNHVVVFEKSLPNKTPGYDVRGM
jgi:hypothetical protein